MQKLNSSNWRETLNIDRTNLAHHLTLKRRPTDARRAVDGGSWDVANKEPGTSAGPI